MSYIAQASHWPLFYSSSCGTNGMSFGVGGNKPLTLGRKTYHFPQQH